MKGATIANTWSFVSGSSKASVAAAVPPKFVASAAALMPACVVLSSPL